MEDAWADFLKTYKEAKPFKNKGWVHLEKMSSIMPATVKGTHVFRPSQGLSGMDAFDDNEDLPIYPIGSQEEEEQTLDIDDGPVAEPVVSTPTVSVYLRHLFILCSSFRQIIPPTPPRASCKRERAESETPFAAKRVRGTGAAAINSLTALIGRFGDNICKVLAGDGYERTPQRRTKAVKLAQKEDWLVIDDRLILCNIFERDIKAADAYLALDPEDIDFRQMWMQHKVEDIKTVS